MPRAIDGFIRPITELPTMVLGGVLPDTPLVYGFVILTVTGFIWFGGGWLEA